MSISIKETQSILRAYGFSVVEYGSQLLVKMNGKRPPVDLVRNLLPIGMACDLASDCAVVWKKKL